MFKGFLTAIGAIVLAGIVFVIAFVVGSYIFFWLEDVYEEAAHKISLWRKNRKNG